MSKRVVSRVDQTEHEVDSETAQNAALRGDAALLESSQTVIKGDQIMEVPTERLAEAVARGWSLADNEEAAQVQIRREESDFASGALGAGEAALAGVTLGGSTWLADALGADSDRMAARREGLGDLGTGLEVGGAVAGAFATGGGSLLARAGAGGVRGALRYTPAGALELGAAALERSAGRALAGAPSLVRSVVPLAGRGAVEGFVSGVGAQIHEDVLGDRPLAVDRLLGSGGMGMVFGGGLGAGFGAVIPGVSSAATLAGKLPVEAAGKVLRRASGVVDEVASGKSNIIEKALADGNVPMIAKIFGVPEDSVATLLPSLRTREGRAEIDRMLTSATKFEEEIAQEFAFPAKDLREAIIDMRTTLSRKNKARMAGDKVPAERRLPAIMSARKQLDDFEKTIDGALARNAELGGEFYDTGALLSLKKRAQLSRGIVDDAIAGAKGRAPSRGTGGKFIKQAWADTDAVGTSFRALDEMKQDADMLLRRMRSDPATRARNTVDILGGESGAITSIRRHLEDVEVWADMGLAQKEMNAAVSYAARLGEAPGDSAAKRLMDTRRPDIDNKDLLSVVRDSGKWSGEQATERFRNRIQAEIDAAETIAKHNELSPDQLRTLERAKQAIKKWDSVTEAQRSKVERMQAMEVWRNAEGNRSVSMGAFSGPGNVMATLLGGAVGGLPGAAVGYAASMAGKPYTMLRKYTAIMRQIDKGEKGQIAAVAGFVNKLGSGAAKVASAAKPGLAAGARAVGSVARAGAFRGAGMSAADKRKRNDAALERAQYYARNPAALGEEIRGGTLNIEDVAPSLAGELGMATARAAAFLASKAPTKWSDPLGRVELVDKHSQARFDRYAETVLEPLSVLARMEDGTLSLEHAEALREVYPAMYADLQRRLMDAITEPDVKIPYAGRVQLAVVMQMPADAMMRPEMMAATQAALASSPEPQPQQGPRVNGGKAGSLKGTAGLISGAGRIEGGGARMG